MLRRILLLGLLASIALGCRLEGDALRSDFRGIMLDPSIPEPGELQAKIDQLHAAWQEGSYRQWYLLAKPELRASTDYYTFAAQIERHRLTPTFWRIYSIDAWTPGEEVRDAVVVMSLRLIDESGRERFYANMTDFWVYMDGEWYWSSRMWRLD